MSRGNDYSGAEVETLAELATTTLLDDWHSWSGTSPSHPDTWRIDPELADELDTLFRRYRRLNQACKKLYDRGLVERRTFPELGRGWWYRLIPMLRPAVHREPDEPVRGEA